jgi:LacI family transcriptional regulator
MATGFAEVIEDAGYTVQPVTTPELIRTLPQARRPAGMPGVFCPSDRMARRITRQAIGSGLNVPEDLVVLGVGNNRMLCGAPPTLSSVALPLSRIGIEAVNVLEQLLEGKTGESRYLRPLNVVSRDSTRVIPVSDPAVRAAIGYMRDNLAAAIGVPDIAHASGTHVRVLQRRFKKTLGRTISKELLRLRMARAQELLRSTNQPVKAIAIDTGYRYLQSFLRAFREHTGTTPTLLRKAARQASQG